ncbi:hypothetical protein NPIL_111161 [Nephila pilipes]|uniref:Uncharacterized protein n=1 Tax=Nephila pilipes TaxID=299642 RepID=A0A8X6NSS4_NEPPI|nr:hypothetical protein NPIL_111161 [Nephila pilipes]
MNLRKWATNNRNLVKELEEENYDIHPILNNSNVTKLKVLGIQWDFQDDGLSVETAWVTEFLKRKKNTKPIYSSDSRENNSTRLDRPVSWEDLLVKDRVLSELFSLLRSS